MNEIHLNALDEIYSKTIDNKSIKNSIYFEIIKENIDELNNTSLNKNFDKKNSNFNKNRKYTRKFKY